MTPIYFPFTWADASTLQSITTVFPKIAIYQPARQQTPLWLHPFEKAETIEIRVPIPEECEHLKIMAADYQNWARLHQGNDLAFLKSRMTDAPFIDHLSSRIQSEILHYEETLQTPSRNPVFNARLFLEIAADYDAQQSALNTDLASIEHLENRLMAAIGGPSEVEETVAIGNFSLAPDHPGDFMTAERLQAWSTLFLADDHHRTPDDIWITPRSSVIDWIREEYEMAQILEINCIPIRKTVDDNFRFWQENILTYLTHLQKTPWPAPLKTFEPPDSEYAWEDAVSVKGYLLPNLSPDHFFQKMAASQRVVSSPNLDLSNSTHHTIIVQIQSL